MGKLILITGGARSGKSRFAEDLLKNEENVIYVATGIAFDDEMKERIARHRESRDSQWDTVEAYKDLDKILKSFAMGNTVLVDCVTIMISNIMLLGREIDWDNATEQTVIVIEKEVDIEIEKLLSFARGFKGRTVAVSNELGMGIVPPTPLGRYYRDISGRMNQKIAAAADSVYFLVSGIPVKIK